MVVLLFLVVRVLVEGGVGFVFVIEEGGVGFGFENLIEGGAMSK